MLLLLMLLLLLLLEFNDRITQLTELSLTMRVTLPANRLPLTCYLLPLTAFPTKRS